MNVKIVSPSTELPNARRPLGRPLAILIGGGQARRGLAVFSLAQADEGFGHDGVELPAAGVEYLGAGGLARDDTDAATVTSRALADAGSFEAQTIRLYWRIVARFAGDMAIVFMATGGVTLAGGILPRVAGLLDEAEFRRCFEDKAPVDALAKRCATRLITQPDAVLAGMAAIAAMPGRYAIDYAARAWV